MAEVAITKAPSTAARAGRLANSFTPTSYDNAGKWAVLDILGGVRLTVSLLILVAACSATGEASTTTADAATTTSVSVTSSTVPPLVECPPLEYQVTGLPGRVTGEAAELGAIELDEFTSIGGTRSIFWVTGDGNLAIALIRGTLPPQDWPGERGEIEVAGTDAVVGPFADGTWVAAWFEGDGSDRCDLYTMVFYPPVEGFEVESTLRGITR